MGVVRLQSRIPPDHPSKKGVEEAVCDVLRGLRGDWSAEIVVRVDPSWWLVAVTRSGDAFQGTVFLQAADQHPQAVAALLRKSLEHLC